MRKKGGELLGQGGYACAFYPSINCADGSKNGGISKIFKDIFSYEDELFQLIKVARYDTEAKYSNPMVKSCKVKYEAIQDIDKNKCIWMNGEMAQDDNYQIIYKHKGIDFEKYLQTSIVLEISSVTWLNLRKGLRSLMVRITLIWISKHLICL